MAENSNVGWREFYTRISKTDPARTGNVSAQFLMSLFLPLQSAVSRTDAL